MKNPIRNRVSISTLLVLLLLGISRIGAAATTQYPSQYLNGVAPDIVNQKLAVKACELCYDNFAVMHSGVSRTPLWSAEHLTGQNVLDGKYIKHPNRFHPEAQLPKVSDLS
jgi:endonuclease G